MRLKQLRPILYTTEIGETINFYTQALGFTCTGQNDDWGWASLARDGVEIMLAKPNEHIPFNGPQFTGSFYMDTEDVEAAWEQLKDKAKICYEMEDFDWGMREFAIYDNNGYVIQFGQEISD